MQYDSKRRQIQKKFRLEINVESRLCNAIALFSRVYLREMKIGCFILSFYFMALAGLACADTQPLDTKGDTVSIFEGNDGDHNNQQSSWDGCSPICVCHCCHAHFLSISAYNFTLPVKLPVTFSSYFQDFRSVEISEFLKPPRS